MVNNNVYSMKIKFVVLIWVVRTSTVNPLTAGAAYIRVFIFYEHSKYHLLNMLKLKCDINQQYLKTANLHFVKSE